MPGRPFSMRRLRKDSYANCLLLNGFPGIVSKSETRTGWGQMDDADTAEKPETRKKRATAKAAAPSILPPPPEPAPDAEGAKAVTRRALVDRVQAATGGKKKAVREIVEATLQALGDALEKGEALNVPPLGRLTVKREGKGAAGAMTIKVKRGGKKGEEGLAEADEAE